MTEEEEEINTTVEDARLLRKMFAKSHWTFDMNLYEGQEQKVCFDTCTKTYYIEPQKDNAENAYFKHLENFCKISCSNLHPPYTSLNSLIYC